jgi:protein gp37
MDLCALPHRSWHPRFFVSSTLTIGRDAMDLPSKWAQPAHVFVMPDSDVFEQSPTVIREVFAVMNVASQHEFQVATRHPDRALGMGSTLLWTPNIWLGALLDGNDDAHELAALRETPARVKFAHLRPRAGQSVPPLDLDGLQFVIIQAICEPAGTEALREECAARGVRLFLGPRVENAPLRAGSRAIVPRRIERTGRR